MKLLGGAPFMKVPPRRELQGAQEKQEGRPGGPGHLKTAIGDPRGSFTSWSSWPSFWLLLCPLAIHQAILSLMPAITYSKSSQQVLRLSD